MADYDGNYVIDYEGIEAGMRCCGSARGQRVKMNDFVMLMRIKIGK